MQSDSTGFAADPGPTRTDGPYRPHRDPQVVILVLIVVGTFGVMVSGLGTGPPFSGGNGSDGPVFPVWDYDDGEQPEPEQLTLRANRTLVDPGSAVEFVVVASDRPVANATVSAGDRSERTGRNGSVVVTFDDPGTHEVTVAQSDDEGASTERISVQVRRHRVELAASVDEASVETGQPVRVTLTRADSGETVAGRVVVDGREFAVNESGVARVTFDAAGTYEFSVERAQTATERFVPATVTVDVERRSVPLTLSLSSNRTKVTESVNGTVRRADTGDPVNATLRWGNETISTGQDGTVSLTPNATGSFVVSASADRTDAVEFVTAEVPLTVRHQLVGLELTASSTTPSEGEPVTFTVTRVDTGEPVTGTVELFGTRYVTDADGQLRVAFQVPEEFQAVARVPETAHERFLDGRLNLTIVGAEYAVAGLDAPASATAGDEVTVRATVRNEGTERESATAAYRIDGQSLAEQSVDLAPSESTTVEFTVAVPKFPPGEYVQSVTVEEGQAETTLSVTGNESSTNASNAIGLNDLESTATVSTAGRSPPDSTGPESEMLRSPQAGGTGHPDSLSRFPAQKSCPVWLEIKHGFYRL